METERKGPPDEGAAGFTAPQLALIRDTVLALGHPLLAGFARTEVLPACQKCQTGILLPLSDYGQEGASVIFKAWACRNPECGFSLRVDKGQVTYGQKVPSATKGRGFAVGE